MGALVTASSPWQPSLERARVALAAALLLSALGCGRSAPSTGQNARPSASASATSGPSGRGAADPCGTMSAEQRALVVARIGDTSLTLCDFARRMNLQNQYLRARFTAPEQRRALLRAWVDSELLAAEARARGLDREPAVRHAVTAALARQVETEVRASVSPPAVTEQDARAYFEAHRAEYDTPEQVRASHAVLLSREAAEAALTRARALADDDDRGWRELVRRESVDVSTRDLGGDLGFFSREGSPAVPREVAEAAFALQRPGELAAVVASERGAPGRRPGFHLVRFVARREALHRTLDEVRRAIEGRLAQERADAAQDAALRELVARLRAEAQVSVDEAALAQLRVDAAPGVSPALTGPLPWLAPNASAAPAGGTNERADGGAR